MNEAINQELWSDALYLSQLTSHVALELDEAYLGRVSSLDNVKEFGKVLETFQIRENAIEDNNFWALDYFDTLGNAFKQCSDKHPTYLTELGLEMRLLRGELEHLDLEDKAKLASLRTTFVNLSRSFSEKIEPRRRYVA